jgi:hypothetical protein
VGSYSQRPNNVLEWLAVIASGRAELLNSCLSPAAQSPTDGVGKRNAHLLAHGCESENLYPGIRQPDLAVSHFRDRSIKWWTSSRSGDRRVGDGFAGPTRNLASSQVSCVNFLLPLSLVPGGLAELLRYLDSDVIDVAPVVDKKGLVATIEFEWVGWDQPLEGGAITRGANQTSVDALIIARVPDGLRAYLIEWKYCEEYVSPAEKGVGPSGDKRRSRYAHLFGQSSSSFNSAAPLDDFLFEPYYQIMRMHLLRDGMIASGVSPALPLVDARVVVVCPADNLDYRNVVRRTPLAQRFSDAETVEQVIHHTLKDPRTFSVVAQDDLVAHLRRGALATRLLDWLSYHEERYGW